MDEAEKLRLALQGDEGAFASLIETYQTSVYNLAYRMLGNAVDAEDATQETFVRAFLHLKRYDPARPFRTWLLSIASHYCVDRLRRRTEDRLLLDEDISLDEYRQCEIPMQLSTSAIVEQREREALIRRLLASLPAIERAAIVLCYWYSYSYEEIAEMLGLTVSAVKSRLYRARRALAKKLAQEPEWHVLR